MNLVLNLGLGMHKFTGGKGQGGNGGITPPVGITLTLEMEIGPGVPSPGAGKFKVTLSEALPSDLEITIVTDQAAAEVFSPQTISAGELTKSIFVANTGGYDGPVNITVTTDNVDVTVVGSPIQFTFSS